MPPCRAVWRQQRPGFSSRPGTRPPCEVWLSGEERLWDNSVPMLGAKAVCLTIKRSLVPIYNDVYDEHLFVFAAGLSYYFVLSGLRILADGS